MKLYFCTDDLWGLELCVAAKSRRKAKSMYCDYYDPSLDFTMVHTYIMCHDYDGPAGAYEVPSQACRACGARL